MKREVFGNLTGEQVEIFLTPNMPYTSGVLTSCDDDFVTIDGDEIWSYKAILGLRIAHGQLPKRAEPVTPKTVKQTAEAVSTEEPKEVTEPVSVTQQVTQPVKEEPKKEEEKKSEAVKVPEPVSVPPKGEQPEQKSKSEEVSAVPVKETQTVKEEPKKEEKKPEAPKVPEIKLPDREFTGILTDFYYDHRRWGFIKSAEVLKAGVPLRDGEKVFVHLNQITDKVLRKKLLDEKPETPDIEVTFRLMQNQKGIAADDVRTANHVKIGDILPLGVSIVPTEEAKPEDTKSSPESPSTAPAEATAEVSPEAPTEAPVNVEKDEGEIDYYRRYDPIPHGEIRMKGNKLFRFDYDDVIDPILAVFLEVSPSAEGQAVKFVQKTTANGKNKATNVEAAVPFPEEKIKEWEKSGLLKKKEEEKQEA